MSPPSEHERHASFLRHYARSEVALHTFVRAVGGEAGWAVARLMRGGVGRAEGLELGRGAKRGGPGARSFKQSGWLRLVAEGERSEGRGGGLRGTSTRSHGAQAVRSRAAQMLRRRTHDIASTNDAIEPEAGAGWLQRPHYASGHSSTHSRWTHPAGIVPSSATGGLGRSVAG